MSKNPNSKSAEITSKSSVILDGLTEMQDNNLLTSLLQSFYRDSFDSRHFTIREEETDSATFFYHLEDKLDGGSKATIDIIYVDSFYSPLGLKPFSITMPQIFKSSWGIRKYNSFSTQALRDIVDFCVNKNILLTFGKGNDAYPLVYENEKCELLRSNIDDSSCRT